MSETLRRIQASLATLATRRQLVLAERDPGQLRRRARLFLLICLGLVILILAVFGSTMRYKLVSREAHSLWKQGRTEEAISRFQAALKIKPGSADAHNNLGVVLSEKPETLDEGLTELRTAVKINPRHSRAYFHIGNLLSEKEQFDEAIAAYKKQLEIEPRAVVHFKLGKAFQQKGELNNAIARFRKVVQIEPTNVRAHYQLAHSLFRKGRLGEAIDHYEITVRSRPANASAHMNFGLALFQNGQIADAVTQWKKTVELQPDNIDARNSLALALLRSKEVTDAIAQWQKVIEIDSNNSAALISLAWVFATSPDKSIRHGTRALDFAQQAQKLAGEENPVVFRTLAAALAECGRFPEAISAAEQGLTLATAQNQSGLLPKLRSEISLYQLNLPCRDNQ